MEGGGGGEGESERKGLVCFLSLIHECAVVRLACLSDCLFLRTVFVFYFSKVFVFEVCFSLSVF